MAIPIEVLPDASAVGAHVADIALERIAAAAAAGRDFLLGSPTGRTPKPIYAAMAERLGREPRNLSRVTLVMMDEYLVDGPQGLQYAPSDAPWSCHRFVADSITGVLNAALPERYRMRSAAWYPDPKDPAAYDRRIADAGGIDLFILASGASDGHVAFNPPGSARTSTSRVIPLSEDTRRDNLRTSPTFGTLENVPRHGVSVGIDTITRSREAIMVVWGTGKRQTLARIKAAHGYEPDWPATLIHECRSGRVVADADAAS
ncbi:MAG TPA: 6-phosphogluconolactonase [Gemmatimonadaceae bacterium]|nr:6-phosphogluconolactonase [Gemmatimonadaceae bacterium]